MFLQRKCTYRGLAGFWPEWALQPAIQLHKFLLLVTTVNMVACMRDRGRMREVPHPRGVCNQVGKHNKKKKHASPHAQMTNTKHHRRNWLTWMCRCLEVAAMTGPCCHFIDTCLLFLLNMWVIPMRVSIHLMHWKNSKHHFVLEVDGSWLQTPLVFQKESVQHRECHQEN